MANNNVSLETQFLPTLAQRKVYDVIVANIDKYPEEKWKTQDVEEHLAHAVDHIASYQAGDKSEDHLAHALTRIDMAISKAGE